MPQIECFGVQHLNRSDGSSRANAIGLTTVTNPLTAVPDQYRWIVARDKFNGAIDQLFPNFWVRLAIGEDLLLDWARSVELGVALTVDNIHSALMSFRAEDSFWWEQGCAIGILVPVAGDLDWETIASLRKDRYLVAYRRMLAEVEQEALAAAASGADIRMAVERSYARKLRGAVEKLEGLGSVLRNTVKAFVIGTGTGMATIGMTGPVGPIVGAAGGAIVGAALDAKAAISHRRRNGWVTFDQRLRNTTENVATNPNEPKPTERRH